MTRPAARTLPFLLQVLARFRAAAVDLVTAGERQAVGVRVGEYVDGELPLVRNRNSSGSPVTSDFTGSSMSSAGIHCRAPVSACPVLSRTQDRCTVLMPFATRPAQPMYCRLTPAVELPCFCWPVSSSAATAIRRRRHLLAAWSSAATACLLTWLIAAISSHDVRFSSRCARSGVRSPACSATDHPFRGGSSLASADTYFPACSHVWARVKHDRSAPMRVDRSRSARRVPILAAAAPDSFVLTSNMITGGCAHAT